MIDEDSRILFANGATANIFGYDPNEELVGRSLTMLMPEYLRQVHEASLKRYMDTGKRHLDWDAIELPGLHKSGEEVPLEVSFGEFFKEGRRFFTGFLRDITERKRAEERIRESERRYRAVVEQATEGILLVDVDSKRILEANAAYHDLLGYSFEEILELTLYDIVPYSRQDMDCYVERVLEEGNYVSGERRHRRKDGSLVDVEVSANIISYGGREVMCILVRDITERKRADEEIRSRARQQAAVADLSRHALAEADLTLLMNEAVEVVSRTLEVEYCKVLELLPDGEELLLRAGVGWQEGMVGQATVGAHLDSQAGYTLVSDEPVVSEDLGSETRLAGHRCSTITGW